MKALIGLVISIVLLVGCQSQEEKEKIASNKRNAVLIESCINRLKIYLKDPDWS